MVKYFFKLAQTKNIVIIKGMEDIDKSDLEDLKQRVKKKLDETNLYSYKGTVSKLLGLTVEVKLPGLKIGDLCYIETANGEQKPAEVAAF